MLTTDNFFYVSLLDTLKTLLSIEDVQAEVLNPHSNDRQLLGDFCDGNIYNEHPLFSADELALQIIGYYDELEVVNPIGSYVSTHKLGCLFFFLANIRPQFRSTMKAINLLAVGKQEDIKHYGIDEFLRPFVEDLKVLYYDGIEVEMNGSNCCSVGGLLAFLADNLTAHAVGGFKESMSFALRICRTCMITKTQAQLVFNESNCVLRDPETHFEQCQLLLGQLADHNSISYGVNRLSILESVPGFSVTTGMPHDILHDLFEGVVPLELKLLIEYCIEQRFFTFSLVNDRLSRFNYLGDKPSLLSGKSGNN